MILVSGANGLNGFKVAAALSKMKAPVRALVRREPNAALAALPGVEIVKGDMSQPETLAPAFHGADHAMLISSAAEDMVSVQKNFIDAAKAAGVRHVVKLSGIIPGLDSPFRFARMHAEVEAYLEASGLAFTHLRAGEFMESYFRQLRNIVSQGKLLLPMEDAKIATLDTDDIAAAAALVLTAAGHEGKTYHLTGPEALTMHEIAAKISAATGEPVSYFNVAPQGAKDAQLAAGRPPYLVEGIAELFAERRKGAESKVYPDLPALLGRPAGSFDAFAARYAAVFKGEEKAPGL